mgnify:CR=1 FL=1
MRKITLLLLISICTISCESDETTIDTNNLLFGSWIAPIYEGETTSFERGNSLPNKGYGVSFKLNGDFIERTSGFCGTPPLIFSDYKGYFEI